jgi:hypothetical protein
MIDLIALLVQGIAHVMEFQRLNTSIQKSCNISYPERVETSSHIPSELVSTSSRCEILQGFGMEVFSLWNSITFSGGKR